MDNLQLFCSADIDERFSTPFGDGEFTYATDGHLIVKVPFVEGTKREFPVKLGEKMKFVPEHDGGWRELPQYDQPVKIKCRSCRGCKTSSVCDDCEGDGCVSIPHGRHWYEAECKECGGEGLIPGGSRTCTSCNGTGEEYEDRYAGVKVENVKISVKLLEKMKSLPGVKIFLPALPNTMVSFRFDGGVGLVMGMKE